MMRIVINPNDLSKPERAEERIADLEKQLAEERAARTLAERMRDDMAESCAAQLAEERRAAEQNHLAACQEKDRAENLTRQLAEQTKRASQAEEEVARLSAEPQRIGVK